MTTFTDLNFTVCVAKEDFEKQAFTRTPQKAACTKEKDCHAQAELKSAAVNLSNGCIRYGNLHKKLSKHNNSAAPQLF